MDFFKKFRFDTIDLLVFFLLAITFYYILPVEYISKIFSTTFSVRVMSLFAVVLLISINYARSTFLPWTIISKKEKQKYPIVGVLSALIAVAGLIILVISINNLVEIDLLKPDKIDKALITKDVHNKIELQKSIHSTSEASGAVNDDTKFQIKKALNQANLEAEQQLKERKKRLNKTALILLSVGFGLFLFSIALSWLRNRLS